ncbi:MAG: cytochrome c-type biogenesis protein CcmH, partial [Vicinamibacterales bacterium]
CMCGTCGRQAVGVCTCAVAQQMRAEIAGLVREGKTEDEVIQYYIQKYGSQEPLAAPIDEGFNRLAWAFPYLVGVAGLLLVGVTARRWSRRGNDEAAGTPSAHPEDAEMAARLDDELRDLD